MIDVAVGHCYLRECVRRATGRARCRQRGYSTRKYNSSGLNPTSTEDTEKGGIHIRICAEFALCGCAERGRNLFRKRVYDTMYVLRMTEKNN
jgi:hypothetical protein